MGKFFAAMIMAAVVVWLGPMCSNPVSAPAPEPVAAPAPEPAPAPVPVPVPPAGEPMLGVSTYRLKRMFPLEKGKYQIPVYRENRGATEIADVHVTLIARHEGVEIERAENRSPLVLAPGSTGYYSLGLSTGTVEKLLDAPLDAGAELDWAVTYARRCVRLRALPRRRDPEGIDWVTIDALRACAR